MTRFTFISFCAIVLGLAAPAAAQLAPRESVLAGVDQASLAAAPVPSLLAQSRSQAPRPAPPVRRRRGTFVGYIDDALPQSNLRVRFDAASGNTVPDRAEFFYAKCGCYRGLAVINPPAFDPSAPGPGGGAANDLKFQQLYLEGEYQVAPQLSVLGQVPLRWLQPQSFIAGTGTPFSNQSGLGDVRVGAKLAFVDTAVTTASVKVQVYFPSGDASKGLGTDHASWEPAVLVWNELTPKVNLESQLGVWLPVGGSAPVPTAADGHFAGRVLYYGIGPSFTLYDAGRTRIAPVVELVGWHVISGNQTAAVADASGVNIVNLKIGARIAVDRGSFYAGYGHALTDAAWYTDIVRFEYRYSF